MSESSFGSGFGNSFEPYTSKSQVRVGSKSGVRLAHLRAGRRTLHGLCEQNAKAVTVGIRAADQVGKEKGAAGTSEGGCILKVQCEAAGQEDVMTRIEEQSSTFLQTVSLLDERLHLIEKDIVKEVEDLKTREALLKRTESDHGKPPKASEAKGGGECHDTGDAKGCNQRACRSVKHKAKKDPEGIKEHPATWWHVLLPAFVGLRYPLGGETCLHVLTSPTIFSGIADGEG
uniref:Uncharacterized protein n=1 Tax=Ananas comosus var. bracteatus TaxID=296719 RepID=A0A6V7NSN8_ANACO|nr:unnamed protein product [Ananas comosus var. bracteatus]